MATIKIMRIGTPIVALLALLVFLTVGAHAQNAAAGKEIYAKKCQVCHGADGSGNPGMAKALNVQMKSLGSDDVQKESDADLQKIITQGSGKMKPVAGLSDKEVDDVIAHVRAFKAK